MSKVGPEIKTDVVGGSYTFTSSQPSAPSWFKKVRKASSSIRPVPNRSMPLTVLYSQAVTSRHMTMPPSTVST